MATVIVVGSNLEGRHGSGAAKYAKEQYGAQYGVGKGRSGNSYLIPTKINPTYQQRQMPLSQIQDFVTEFIVYATNNPEDTFMVTRVGCGRAGYTDDEMSSMFVNVPNNCQFDPLWKDRGLKTWVFGP
jgi:hypothetical protein